MSDIREPARFGLVERDLELAEVEAAVAACAAGIGETLLIEGQLGSGKTKLLEAALGRARAAGLTVLRIASSSAASAHQLSALAQLADDPDMSPAGRARLRVAVASGQTEPVDVASRADPRPAGSLGTGVDAVAREFVAVLRDLSLEGPVVLGVDDTELLDAGSRECLRQAARALRMDAVLFVCAGTPDAARDEVAGSRRPTHQRNLWLGGLSPDGVEQLLGDRVAASRPGPTAAAGEEWALPRHAFDQTGGNPLLLRAWVDECARRAPRALDSEGPAAGGAFSQAVRTLVRRLSKPADDVLVAASVLGDQSSAVAVAALLGLPTVTAAIEIRRLEALGLLADGRFRSDVARDVVYAAIDPGIRADLHTTAARLLDRQQIPVTVPADHLIVSGRIDPDAGVRILMEASDEVLQADRTDEAIRYLEHAVRASDGQRRGYLLAALAVVASRLSPAVAESYLEEALAAERAGQLSDEGREALAWLLIGQGRVGELRDLGHLPIRSGGSGVKSHFSHLWSVASSRPHPAPDTPGHLVSGVALLSSSAVWTVPPGSDSMAVTAAERLLEVSPLTDRLRPPIVNAVKVLAFADRVRKAERWCRALAAEADRRSAAGWRAILVALLAEILLLQGYCDDGIVALVEDTLAVAPPRGTGLFWVAPMASKVLAYTRAGRYVEASACLDRPPPAAVFSGFDGLGYLRARGHYYLAASYPRAALDDFRAIGRIVADWDVDDPALVPWRLDAAEACLTLGLTSEAQDLLAVQTTASPSATARTRGRTLRLHAATLAPRLRSGPLVQAVEELRRSGDRYELACTYADLGRAYDHAGDRERAAQFRGKAASLATECGATPLADAMDRDRRRGPSPARPATPSAVRQPLDGAAVARAEHPMATGLGGGALSDSEHRVITLAARGFSNRQIASRLAITVSTVEQHLTRAYRKLGITRRSELPDLILRLPTSVEACGSGGTG